MTNSNTVYLPTTNSKNEKKLQWIEVVITIAVLAVLLLFSYTQIFLLPFSGYSFNSNTGEITGISIEAEGYLYVGDYIVSIDDIAMNAFNTSGSNNPMMHVKPGEVQKIVLIRDGEQLEVNYPFPSQRNQSLVRLLTEDWILAFPFFGAGLITILFFRPRTKTRNLLIAFFYSYTVWISAGAISNTGYWASPLIMRVFIWISVPITLHLHWIFPKSFRPWKKWQTVLFYGFFGLVTLAESFNILPKNLYLAGFFLSLIAAISLLIVKYFRFKEFRPYLEPLLLAFLLALLPLMIMVVLMIANIMPPKATFTLLGLTAIPGFYFFTAYRINLKQEIRQINNALQAYTLGVLAEFGINFIILLLPPETIRPEILNFLSFLTIIFIMVTGFGILLILPALAGDQTDLYQTTPANFHLSANRMAAFINYVLMITPLTLLVMLLISASWNVSFGEVMLFSMVSILLTSVSILTYRSYQRRFDQLALGIKHPQEELIRKYAQQITTSLDLEALAELIKGEILPSLMIRESALVYFHEQFDGTLLFSTGIPKDKLNLQDFKSHFEDIPNEAIIQYLSSDMPWVKLAIPLQIEGRTIGVWLFGRKDPNNNYDLEFQKNLHTLANQTTLALLNIRQSALLQALYNANVDRQETQKEGLARDLHDVLLPSINYLAELQNNACDPFEFEEAVQRVNNMVREIMSGLRPASLDMGLDIALEELADEPESQIGGKIKIITQLQTPGHPVNYEPFVALHLYRMVQQASHNALEHAHANTIQIIGTLESDQVDLYVQDDGVGFPIQGIPELSTLIANRHFGLANIFERAKIINAKVSIASQSNQGTSVHIYWTSSETMPKL